MLQTKHKDLAQNAGLDHVLSKQKRWGHNAKQGCNQQDYSRAESEAKAY